LRPFFPSLRALASASDRFTILEFTGDTLDRFIFECCSGDQPVLLFKRRSNRKRAFR
jgi:hypothetical protein